MERISDKSGNHCVTDNGKEYLQDLMLQIKKAYVSQERLNFKIIKPSNKGFLVKVNGLFAFVSYHHMPWQYVVIDYWDKVADSLVNKVFQAKVYKMIENPISIVLDAKGQTFEKAELIESEKYRGIVLNKVKYGLFVDIGYHFDWEYGSMVGLIHRSSMPDQLDYENAAEGDILPVTFAGYNAEGQILFGDNSDRLEWLKAELLNHIGTVQKVTVVKKDNEPVEFYVLNKYKARLSIPQENKTASMAYIDKLTNGQEIDCLIRKMNKAKNGFVVEFVNKPQ